MNIRFLAALALQLTALLCLTAAQAQDVTALVEQGKAVAIAADCVACHTLPQDGRPYAGGYGIASPLGTIYSTNITPSVRYGIGAYSEEDFARAVRQGIRKDGTYLYPAMPYDAYGAMTDADIQALYAYLMHGVEPVDMAPQHETELPFPFNLRISMAAWNLLFAGRRPFEPDPAKSAAVNRGAYLARALGHCASCHAPRNFLMGQGADAPLVGGMVGSWYAPNITSDEVSGIGGWTDADLIQYFRTGRVPGKAQAAGGMAEAVQNSLQYWPQSDLEALVAYLKATPPVRDSGLSTARYAFGGPTSQEADIRGLDPANAANSLEDGARLYSGLCASCHQPDGSGSSNQAYPSIFHNTATGAGNPANLISTILYGVERDVGDDAVLMPGFGKGSYVAELSDAQIADIANYVLRSFGNSSLSVGQDDVATARNGGPVPLLARLQPYALAATVIGGIIFLLLIIYSAPALLRGRAKRARG